MNEIVGNGYGLKAQLYPVTALSNFRHLGKDE